MVQYIEHFILKYKVSNSSSKDNVLLMFEVKLISIPSVGWWVGMVSSKDILLKCRTNVDRYSSAGVGGLCVGIFSSLQGWLCVGVLCALQCAKNSVGRGRQSQYELEFELDAV